MFRNKSALIILSTAFVTLVLSALPSTTFAARKITAVTLNGTSTVSIAAKATIPVSITVVTSGNSTSSWWQSTSWQIATSSSSGFTCVNTQAVTSTGTFARTFSATAPATAGVYYAYFIAYTATNCTEISNKKPSPTLTLTKAVTVTAAPPPPPPPPPPPAPAPSLAINPATLPNGTTTIAYSQTLTASTTATGTFAWKVSSGALPGGLLLSTSTKSTATIAGTPTAAGTSTFSINATNGSSSSTRSYTVHMFAASTGSGNPTSTPTSTTPNLILNPNLTLDTVVSGTPDEWNQGGWGTNTTSWNYPVAGMNGGVGENVTVSSYTSGDAKWYFNNVFVTPGSSYTFSDSYNSNVASELVIQYTATNGTLSYVDIASLPSTNGAWANASETFTVPAAQSALTIFHLIGAVGSLTTSNYSLKLASAGTGTGLFPEGLVSLTFDDGWESQYDNALPILQAANMHGTFYIISDGMLNAIETIFPSSDNPFDVATTTKTATWSQIYTDPTQHTFTFTDTYTANGPSTVTVNYTPATGPASSTVLGPLPAGTNASANFSFALPVLAASTPLTITQAVTGTNTLTTSNPVVSQPIGYMDTSHVVALQSAGEEIGDHTVNHCDLAAINVSSTNTANCAVDPPVSTTVQAQVDNARTALQNAGLSPVDTFAYPYGSGAGNSQIEAIIKADGIIAARSVNTGYNTPTTDPYDLLNEAVDTTVTSPAQVEQWINYAATNKVWLVLTFHQIELSTSTIIQNGETDATTASMLQSIVSYLGTERATGAIDVDTVNNIMNQFMK